MDSEHVRTETSSTRDGDASLPRAVERSTIHKIWALDEAVRTMGVPEPAARAILLGHIQVSLANSLQGDNPYSDACHIAMQYGREKIIKEDWKVIFRDDELDKNLQRMLHLPEPIKRGAGT